MKFKNYARFKRKKIKQKQELNYIDQAFLYYLSRSKTFWEQKEYFRQEIAFCDLTKTENGKKENSFFRKNFKSWRSIQPMNFKNYKNYRMGHIKQTRKRTRYYLHGEPAFLCVLSESDGFKEVKKYLLRKISSNSGYYINIEINVLKRELSVLKRCRNEI